MEIGRNFDGAKPDLSGGSLPARSKLLENRFMSRTFNYAPILTDEIALEGLDGITLQGRSVCIYFLLIVNSHHHHQSRLNISVYSIVAAFGTQTRIQSFH